jgi:hypothetical protein
LGCAGRARFLRAAPGPGNTEVTMDVNEFLDQHHANLSPVERAMALDAVADAKADAVSQREKAERQVAAEERAEALQLANRAGDDPLGGLRRARADFEAADDVCRDLAGKLEKATARRDRALESVQGLSRRMDEITGLAQRAAPAGVEGAAVRAREALAEAVREDDILRRARRLQEQRRPRPVAIRSRPFGGSGEVNGTASRRGDRAATHSLRLETHEELKALPRGASSRGGCPPCDDCGFVICRCGQNPGALRSGAYSEPLGQMVSRVTEGAMVSVR